MNKFLWVILFFLSFQVSAQTSEKYNSEYANFYRAEELFQKEQYAAARKEFRIFMDGFNHENDPFYIKASYYEAVSALELYNNDAEDLLMAFIRKYPESVYRTDIYFRLGKFYYYKKDYEEAIVWLNKLSAQDIPEENRDEFYFKLGYANFREDNLDAARNAFVEIKDGNSEYSKPALYYYSHIAYTNKSYQVALEGFLKLEDDEKFGKLVPYYIAQIYYLQGKYDEVTKYASKISGDGGVLGDKDINLLIGDAYYRTGRFNEAVPYLEKYNRATNTSREDDYRLGYAYYKSGKYDQAVPMFDRVKTEKDSLGQIAFYHIGECMLKLNNKVSARSAFEGAAFIDEDPVVQEDALYNYAILSYQLDINPYDEAVEAFELYLNRYPNSKRKEDIYQYLVNVYLSTNNYDKALASLDKLPNKDIRLKQAYQLISYNQGVSRYQRNEWANAITSFKNVEKYPIDPNISGLAVYWTGDSYYRLNEYDKAVERYTKFGTMPGVSAVTKSDAKYNIGYCHWNKAELKHGAMENLDPSSSQYKALQAQRETMLNQAIQAFGLFIESDPMGKNKKADGYMRIADSYFITKNNLEAVNNYKKAFALQSGFEDQALYYMALTYGYMSGKTQDKITNLIEIINNYPKSKYVQVSIIEVAETYKSESQFDKALTYYNKIVDGYPNSTHFVEAKINIADIHFKQGKASQAEQEYKAIMAEYGSSQSVCKEVAESLRDLYMATNQLQKIDELMQYSCFNISQDEKENIYYIPAVQAYFDSTLNVKPRFTNAIPKLEAYLDRYPTGKYKDEIRFYLANCHFSLGDESTGIAIYRELLESPNNLYTEFSAARVASYLYNQENYLEAIPYYKRLEQSSYDPEKLSNAKLRLMVCHYKVQNWQNAALYADKVLQDNSHPTDVKAEAHHIKALSNYQLEHYLDAQPSLVWLRDNLTTIWAAEARFLLADIKFRNNNYEGTKADVEALLKMKPQYNYWVAKGIILRARVYMAEDNLFQADRDIQSILQHYKVTDDGILDEARALNDELMQLKNAPKPIQEEGQRIIEIEEGNGN